MSRPLLPPHIDNTYRGHKAALWLFGLVVGLRTIQSLVVIFDGYSTAINADGIPLDTYPPAAAQTAVALFAQASLWRLTFCSVCVLVLVRYRRAVPLMFAALVLNFLAAQLLFRFVPLARAGTPPGPYVNLTLFALAVIGLVLSLRSRGV
jgi:ABC-type amino acid transport system permease subunit